MITLKKWNTFAGFGVCVATVFSASLLIIGIATRKRTPMSFSILFFFILQFLQSSSFVFAGPQMSNALKSSFGAFLITVIVCTAQWYFLVVIISYWNVIRKSEEKERARETLEMTEMGVHSHDTVRRA